MVLKQENFWKKWKILNLIISLLLHGKDVDSSTVHENIIFLKFVPPMLNIVQNFMNVDIFPSMEKNALLFKFVHQHVHQELENLYIFVYIIEERICTIQFNSYLLLNKSISI